MTLNDYKNFFEQQLNGLYDEEERKALLAVVMDEVLNYSRADMVLKKDEELLPEIQIHLTEVVTQLQKEIPVQYIFGKAHFYGYEFKVSPATLIPRRETEELVEWILEAMNRQPQKKWTVLDIGTGSGCIPITIKKEFSLAEVSAIDISPEALSIAEENAHNLNVKIRFIQQNILETKTLDKYDIIISNPPYVRHLEKAEMKNNVLRHEPHLALFVENEDPLIFYRKIMQLAKESLTENGVLFFEINQYLGNEMTELVSEYFDNVILKKDLQGNDRMMKIF
ncbi:peptide chain release factor N(5)-glutamine methyltransferase [Avrilella dinanensis]|uniref:Release factor glutamine methyltransferase n=1 Tax=Avrilella dinanensis TaxID=2008672 RepID=A0A2M9R3T5_9FLAO|nr:peptide chain release factor N(5)-glutamine methyltransferase [Avrilella dinanensis]PJR03512.1 protein-(glutamine-N5) methyltransferase, release factor-specific [Avrilella dinanensis]